MRQRIVPKFCLNTKGIKRGGFVTKTNQYNTLLLAHIYSVIATSEHHLITDVVKLIIFHYFFGI